MVPPGDWCASPPGPFGVTSAIYLHGEGAGEELLAGRGHRFRQMLCADKTDTRA